MQIAAFFLRDISASLKIKNYWWEYTFAACTVIRVRGSVATLLLHRHHWPLSASKFCSAFALFSLYIVSSDPFAVPKQPSFGLLNEGLSHLLFCSVSLPSSTESCFSCHLGVSSNITAPLKPSLCRNMTVLLRVITAWRRAPLYIFKHSFLSDSIVILLKTLCSDTDPSHPLAARCSWLQRSYLSQHSLSSWLEWLNFIGDKSGT